MMTYRQQIPDPLIYREVSHWLRSEPMMKLQTAFVDLISRHQVPHADNILKNSDWVNYCYYCYLVRSLVSDPEAFIIDWGGLYGHITMILRTMGLKKAHNYLLHKTPHYALFEEQFGIPTLWGLEPNRLSLDSRSVDAFISSGVLEHVREDGQGQEACILKEMYRVLKDDGLLFIWNLPAKWGSSELLAMAAGKWHHQVRYWEKEIFHLLKMAGFEILYWDKHKFFPGSAMQRIQRWVEPIRLLKFDNTLSHVFPFNLLARDFVFIARKAAASSRSGKENSHAL
jgi:SAM-dependent methyltransferase